MPKQPASELQPKISDQVLLETLAEYVLLDRKEGTPEHDRHMNVYNQVDDWIQHDPGLIWRMIELAFASELSDADLAYLSASAFENLMDAHGEQFIDRVEVAWRREARMRFAVAGVWTYSIKEPVKSRIEELKKKGGTVV